MGGLLPLLVVSFLLVAVDGADSLAKITDEAIASPAEVKAYWGATLPNTPMPQAILDMLAMQEDGKSGKEQGSKVYGDGSNMGKILVYNQGAQADGDGSKMGKLLIYNQEEQDDRDDSKMGKILIYNQAAQTDGDGSKMGKILIYNHEQQDDKDDSKMGKILIYNQAAQGDGDGSKMGKILIYNHEQQDDRDDSKMGKILVYNQAAQADGDGSKMGKILVYNHEHQDDRDDSKMGKFLVYSQGAQADGDGSKMGKFLVYNHEQQDDRDDSKMGKILVYNQAAQADGDGSKMGKQVDGDDSKMTHARRLNGVHKIDGFQKEGVEHKQIPSHGHNHVDIPEGLDDIFFFENSLAIGTTRSTNIPPTSFNHAFLHHDAFKHIPFSPRNLSSIIDMFAPASLTMIEDIAYTLQYCESPETLEYKPYTLQATNGVKPGCATSIESYLEFVVSAFGTSQVRAFSADVPKEGIVSSQRYTTASVRLLSHSQSLLVCHDMVFPYKVVYCHMVTETRAYQVKLISEADGSSVDALAVCHLNTASWDPEFLFFKLMNVKPGQTTACHYINRGSIVWVATAKLGDQQAAATQ